jgi:hypothetical protein
MTVVTRTGGAPLPQRMFSVSLCSFPVLYFGEEGVQYAAFFVLHHTRMLHASLD